MRTAKLSALFFVFSACTRVIVVDHAEPIPDLGAAASLDLTAGTPDLLSAAPPDLLASPDLVAPVDLLPAPLVWTAEYVDSGAPARAMSTLSALSRGAQHKRS